jgi:hypothetical protein
MDNKLKCQLKYVNCLKLDLKLIAVFDLKTALSCCDLVNMG